jgi:hypothetical protein
MNAMQKPISTSKRSVRRPVVASRRNEKRLEILLLQRLCVGDDETFTMDGVRAELRRRIEAKSDSVRTGLG